MTPLRRTLIGTVTGAVTRQRVYRIENGLEMDDIDHFEITRKRVFFDDVVAMTYHQEMGWLFVWLLARFVALPLPSLALAASPGGMAEMSVTAKVMHLSVPLVTATHVLRVVLLTVGAPLLCRRYLAWQARANHQQPGDQT